MHSLFDLHLKFSVETEGNDEITQPCKLTTGLIVKDPVLSEYVDKILAEEFAIFKINQSFLTADIVLLAQVKTIQKAVSYCILFTNMHPFYLT